jgi:hypothetical protein
MATQERCSFTSQDELGQTFNWLASLKRISIQGFVTARFILLKLFYQLQYPIQQRIYGK